MSEKDKKKEFKTSNVYELLGLIINRFGFSGFVGILFGLFIYFKATPEQSEKIIDFSIDLIMLEGKFTHYVVICLVLLLMIVNYFFFYQKSKIYQDNEKKLRNNYEETLEDLSEFRKDKEAIELRKSLELLDNVEGKGNEDILILRKIREFISSSNSGKD